MKFSLYSHLAWTNIKKNSRLYVPYIITGIGLLSIFYIILGLSMDERLSKVKGGSYIPTVTFLGVIVIAILSLILILYTNSFLMKQRTQEFGLYNILGLEKRHICKILLCETTICVGIILVSGILTGIILYKLCVLLICNLLGVDTILGFYHISLSTIVPPILMFLALYGISLLINCIRIGLLKPVQLLQDAHNGEKEPKIKWVLLIIGLVSIIAAYYMSITSEKNVLEFFVAVILVIVGTYSLFITGTIALLKALKKNKKFYYHPRHMISVSSLLYRMKQNAVGLASITIMSTMVLVMISSTISLYSGIEDSVASSYPNHLEIAYSEIKFTDDEGKTVGSQKIELDDIEKTITECVKELGLEIQVITQFHYFDIPLLIENDKIYSPDQVDFSSSNVLLTHFSCEEEFKTLTGINLDLKENEIAIYKPNSNLNKIPDKLIIYDTEYISICDLEATTFSGMVNYTSYDKCQIVVKDYTILNSIYNKLVSRYSDGMYESVIVNFTDEAEASNCDDELQSLFRSKLQEYVTKNYDSSFPHLISSCIISDKFEYRAECYGVYGTLLFLGILLSIALLFTTALVIYYKQITEGYDDRKRFQILQKVGMSSTETKNTIKYQILMMFFLPIVVAAIHLCFASPFIIRMFGSLFDSSEKLYLLCSLGAIGIYVIIYALIYRVTAKIYYQIVR